MAEDTGLEEYSRFFYFLGGFRSFEISIYKGFTGAFAVFAYEKNNLFFHQISHHKNWWKNVKLWVIIALLPYPIRQGKGVNTLAYLITFFVAVGAEMAGHYLCKWLDGHKHGN